jgi:phage-related protein (TIGR01555 family)
VKSQNTTSVADGLVNVASGLGTAKAKRSHNQFTYAAFNTWQQWDAAYQTNWLARQIVDIPAEDMTREWRTIKCEGAEDIRIEEDRLMIPTMVQEAESWARLYGGGGILMITGQDLTKPLNLNAIKRGGLQRCIVFDRYDMSAMTLNTWNILATNYMQPEFYTITGGGQQIHWSHFARFNGARLPRRQMVQTQGWGDSELRKCLDDIMDIVASKDGIAELMQEANIDVITRKGLSDELATDQEGMIIDRYAIFSQMKSIIQMALLDGDETLERQTLNLSGVAPVIETFMTWISGAADIPVTRLFGTSAKGLNATGEGDLTNYFNSIRSKQLTQLDPGMRMLDEVLVRSAMGRWPTDYNYQWNPLRQPDQVELANASKIIADRDAIYLTAGVVQVSQVQRNLQAGEVYQYKDEDIEELEGLEDANMFTEPVAPEPIDAPQLDSKTFMDGYKTLIDSGITHEMAMATLTVNAP